MKTLRIALLTAAAAALLTASAASAQTHVTSSFQVTASVAANCVIQAASDIAITTTAAAWDPTTGVNPTPQAGTITVRCTKGTEYTIDLNGGTYTGRMTQTNGDELPFKLYAADCSTDFTPIQFTATSRAARSHTICAGLDPAQSALIDVASAGDYAATVAVDLTF